MPQARPQSHVASLQSWGEAQPAGKRKGRVVAEPGSEFARRKEKDDRTVRVKESPREKEKGDSAAGVKKSIADKKRVAVTCGEKESIVPLGVRSPGGCPTPTTN
eukprot:scaffold12261_cov67-Isochrysis_galbana.AAC.1